MPVSPGDATDLAKRTHEIYAQSEEILLARVARRLARGEADGGGYERKLLEVQALRREAAGVVERLARGLVLAIEQAVRIGYNRGIASAGAELLDRLTPSVAGAAFGVVNERAVQALVDVAASRMRELAVQVLREVVDAFRDITTRAGAQVVTGAVTRREATAQVVADMAAAGIRFTDRAGRRWEAGAYAEMATRTIAAQAMVQGHLDRLREMGHPLVYVSNSPEECPLCRPWEGRVLTVAGPAGARVVREEHGIRDGEMVRVPVAGSVTEAILAGLMHPNCTHSLSAYIAGITRLPNFTENPGGYERRQRQRALERRVRRWTREAGVLGHARDEAKGTRRTLPTSDPLEKRYRRALKHRKRAVDDLAAFVDGHDRKRLRYRERPVLGRRPHRVSRPADPGPVDPLEGVNLQRMTDEQLSDLFATFADDPDVLAQVEAEFERRDAAEAAAQQSTADLSPVTDTPGAVEFPDPGDTDLTAPLLDDAIDTEADRRVDELVARGWSYPEAYAEVYGLDPEQLAREERTAAIDVHRRPGESRDDVVRRLYAELVHTQWLAAEQATNGYLLSREGTAAGIDPVSLFSGPAARARKYASEELKRWWADNGRVTYTEFRADMLGRRSDREAAERIKRQGNDQDFGI